MTNNFIVRKGQPDDLQELQKLFVDTITTICKTDYDSDQIEAWVWDTKNNTNRKRWQDVLDRQFVLVAQQNNKIVGFATLANRNYIDFLYVHKNYQGQGIAGKLYACIENEATLQQQSVLTSDVSKTARPFFEKQKFKIIAEQTINKKGVNLTNYRMIKKLV